MAVTTNDLKEKTAPANGANPAAVAEAQAHAAAQGNAVNATTGTTRKLAEWVNVSATIAAQSAQGELTAKAGTKVNTGKGTPDLDVPEGAELFLLTRNQDGTVYQAIIREKGFNRAIRYQIHKDSINWPTAAGAPATRSRAADINDELAQVAKDATNKVGKMPIGVATSEHDAAGWAKEFPGCTLANVAAAIIAIEAFRASRAAMLQTAIASKDEEAIKTALREYGRAKSWEQDVRSTAGNCGVL